MLSPPKMTSHPPLPSTLPAVRSSSSNAGILHGEPPFSPTRHRRTPSTPASVYAASLEDCSAYPPALTIAAPNTWSTSVGTAANLASELSPSSIGSYAATATSTPTSTSNSTSSSSSSSSSSSTPRSSTPVLVVSGNIDAGGASGAAPGGEPTSISRPHSNSSHSEAEEGYDDDEEDDDSVDSFYETRKEDIMVVHGMVKRPSGSRLADTVFRSNSNFNLTNVAKEARIGTGRFGCVYRGMWQNTPVALKMISEDDDSTETVGGMLGFDDEAALLFTLRHPNIVDMYGIWTDTDDEQRKRYMVMEYVPDGDLKTLLTQQGIRGSPTLTDLSKIELLQEAVSGMNYLATLETPIIHRDLAARNLLICKSDRDNRYHVKVADFGLARVGSSYSCKHSDTPLPWKWMAPEAMLGTYTAASDVWYIAIPTHAHQHNVLHVYIWLLLLSLSLSLSLTAGRSVSLCGRYLPTAPCLPLSRSRSCVKDAACHSLSTATTRSTS